jgi:DNA invertase Pin-like site-specific DNA recombinase
MTKNTQHQSQPGNSDPELAAKAAIYARVSSFGQLGRDGDEDGYSLPAQVEAGKREATARGAEVVKVYMERAESAKSDDRPVLQAMMRELPTLGVKYLIVHKVDRLARNRLDDATLYQRLVGMGITLVSASENIDETPAGRLMHGMLASFAEYYSNNLATEVKKGLRRKHEQGGTPHRPPIGYRPKREWNAGQDIRTVELDPDRAPLVTLAFDLYATGRWTTRRLAAYLTEQGLRTRPTRRSPERPLTASKNYCATPTTSGRSRGTDAATPASTRPSPTPKPSTRCRRCSRPRRLAATARRSTSTTCAAASSARPATADCSTAATKAALAATSTSAASTAAPAVARSDATANTSPWKPPKTA